MHKSLKVYFALDRFCIPIDLSKIFLLRDLLLKELPRDVNQMVHDTYIES